MPSSSAGIKPARASRFDVTKLGPILEDIHTRLAGVVIECLSWREFIDRYDSPGTLFYLDPPYWGPPASSPAPISSAWPRA